MTRLALRRLVRLALAVLLAVAADPTRSAHAICTTDLQGADDKPGQKDLNEFCRLGTCTGGFMISWNFDDTRWTGSNTGDACALFDTDATPDGKANFAVCATLSNGDATGAIPPVISATTCYSCGNTRPDRCTSSVAVSCTSSCSVAVVTDPLTGSGHTQCNGPNCETKDAQATCCIKTSELPGTSADNLNDVCSYPSSQPNSDPSDCIITTECNPNNPGTTCNDDNPCTVDTCTAEGVCTHTPASSTTVCRASAGVCDVAENCTGTTTDCPADGFASATTQCRASAGVCDPAENCTGSSAACPADAKSTAVCRASAGVCDIAESCDGVNNACPTDAFQPSSVECRASAGVCDSAEKCTGSSAACPADAKSTALCRASAGGCDVAENCDGVNNACPADGFQAGTVECRASAGVCDPAENCTGSSAACPADAKSTAVCRASAGVCDVAENCDGVNDDCPTDAFKLATFECRASAGVCDTAENCTGSSAVCPPDAKSTALCRAPAGVCDVAEDCDGASDTCPPDGFQPASVECRASAGVCDLRETCTGSNAICPPDAKSTALCRPSAGVCDIAENCDGGSDDCPADGFQPNTVACRASAGVCDPAENCTGSSAACPADAKSTSVCRASAGICDVAENCDGVNDACPADVFQPATVECRASAGVCDPPENCTGSAAACPADAKSTAVCRASAGVCDVAENCDGVNAACPADTFQPGTTVCRASAGVCDPAENCTGSSAACPPDAKSTAVCRASAGVCDVAENCDGVNAACPADVFRSSTTVCRPSVGVCDPAENCTGSSAACPPDVKSTQVCRASAGVCDVAESCDGVDANCPPDAKTTAICRAATNQCDVADRCDGVNNACPADRFQSPGEPCGDTDGDVCTIPGCDGAGACNQQYASSQEPECLTDCGDDVTDPCKVTVSTLAGRVYCEQASVAGCTHTDTTKPALQKAIDAAANGATITVTGRCRGPIRIINRQNLIVQGVVGTTPAGCASGRGPAQNDLTSTVADGCDSSNIGACETIKVTQSSNVQIRYLNVVDGVQSCIEYRESTSGRVFCNCVARCQEEGIELDLGQGNVAIQNLVKGNSAVEHAGIHLDQTMANTVEKNTVVKNLMDGIGLDMMSNGNTVFDNLVEMNKGHGIMLFDADMNQVRSNIVRSNVGNGVPLQESDQNNIDQNQIRMNGDGLTDEIVCGPGSENNTGSNVPLGSPCGVPATMTFERRVAASSDDAEESPSGSVNLSSSDLELVDDGGLQKVGIRFRNVQVPPMAAIVNAYVQFRVDEATPPPTTIDLTIKGQLSLNPVAFTTASGNVSSLSLRPRTIAMTGWMPPPWPTVGAAGLDQRTPNIAMIIQEIVNQPGWASGNALVVFITGTTGKRTAESYDGMAAGAPLLHIEYATSGSTTTVTTTTATTTTATTTTATTTTATTTIVTTTTATTTTAAGSTTTTSTLPPSVTAFQAGVSGPANSSNIDTFLRLSTATTNWGSDPELIVGVANAADKVFRSLIEFDLGSIPSNATVSACTLRVNVMQRTSPTLGHIRRLCGNHWTDGNAQSESQATWGVWKTSFPWGAAGASSFVTGECSSTSDYTTALEVAYTPPGGTGFFDFPSLKDLCQDAITNRTGWLRLRISQDAEATQSNLIKFSSSDATTATVRPKLTVTWSVP